MTIGICIQQKALLPKQTHVSVRRASKYPLSEGHFTGADQAASSVRTYPWDPENKLIGEWRT